MQAYIKQKYGGPEVLSLGKFHKPSPKPDQLLVKVKAVSVNPLDWHGLRGTPYLIRLSMGLFKPKNSFLGADVSGIVEEVGSAITNFKPGDEVYGEINESGAGSFAEYVCVRQDFWAKKPAKISHEEAAAAPIAALTAIQGLRDHGGLKAGQKVLINGASGGVGTYAVQIAKAMGTHVTAVCSTHKVDQANKLGADEVVDYTKSDLSTLNAKFDLIFDGVGNCEAKIAKKLLKPGGTCLLVGWGGFKHMAKFALANVLVGKKWNLTFFTAKMNLDDLAYLSELLSSGKIKSIIDKQYMFEQLPQAVAYQEDGHASGKVIVTVNQPEHSS